MRFWFRGPAVGLLAGMLVSGPLLGYERDLPEDYLPGVTYCPAGLDSVGSWNAVALAEAAVACEEMGLPVEAYLFYEASEARSFVDRRLFPTEAAEEDQVAVEQKANALRRQFGARFRMDDPEVRLAVLETYDKVFHWLPDVEGYDPGFPVKGMPSAEEYHQLFRIWPAGTYAGISQQIVLDLDVELAELIEEIRQFREATPRPDPYVLQTLATPIRVRREEVKRAFIEAFEPVLVEGRIGRFGIFDSPDPADADASPPAKMPEEFHLSTLIVPAELGFRFGFLYELGGVLPGTEDRLEMRVVHPRFLDVDGQLQTVTTWSFTGRHRRPGYIIDSFTYRFDQPEQLKPGDWTLEIIYFDRVLLSKTFQVIEIEAQH